METLISELLRMPICLVPFPNNGKSPEWKRYDIISAVLVAKAKTFPNNGKSPEWKPQVFLYHWAKRH
jgi:hypothetical protein